MTTFDLATRGKTKRVPHGKRVLIGEVEGSGYIAKLWTTFPGWFWQHWATDWPVDASILKKLILRITFDGAETPQVVAPMGDFFGVGLNEVANFASQYFGMSSGGFFCAFPMPFRRSFRIEVENTHESMDTDVFFNVLYQESELGEEVPTFHAQYHEGENPGPEPVLIANAEGRGWYAGCVLSCQGKHLNYLSFLEAPEHVFIDDDWENPRFCGTGLEDYFLGGWYFREGTFAGPLHGVPMKDTLRSSIAMYRVHDRDAIHFARRLRFEFVNPWAADRLQPFRYSSVGFLYLDRPRAVPEVPGQIEWYRVRDGDHQSIP